MNASASPFPGDAMWERDRGETEYAWKGEVLARVLWLRRSRAAEASAEGAACKEGFLFMAAGERETLL